MYIDIITSTHFSLKSITYSHDSCHIPEVSCKRFREGLNKTVFLIQRFIEVRLPIVFLLLMSVISRAFSSASNGPLYAGFLNFMTLPTAFFKHSFFIKY